MTDPIRLELSRFETRGLGMRNLSERCAIAPVRGSFGYGSVNLGERTHGPFLARCPSDTRSRRDVRAVHGAQAVRVHRDWARDDLGRPGHRSFLRPGTCSKKGK